MHMNETPNVGQQLRAAGWMLLTVAILAGIARLTGPDWSLYDYLAGICLSFIAGYLARLEIAG